MYNVPGQITNPVPTTSSSSSPSPSSLTLTPSHRIPILLPYHPAYYLNHFPNLPPLYPPYFIPQRPQHTLSNPLAYQPRPLLHPLFNQQSYGLPHNRIHATPPATLGHPPRINIQPNLQPVPYNVIQGLGLRPPNLHSSPAHGFRPPNHLLRPTFGFPQFYYPNYQILSRLPSDSRQNLIQRLHVPVSQPQTTSSSGRSTSLRTLLPSPPALPVATTSSVMDDESSRSRAMSAPSSSPLSTNSTTPTPKTPVKSSASPKPGSSKKSRRFNLSKDQLSILEKEFADDPYLPGPRRKKIATALRIPEREVQLWFQRTKSRKLKDARRDLLIF